LETKHFSFTTQSFSASTIANVFIHGYSAGHNLGDRTLLSSQIPQALDGDINLLAFWRSSHYSSISSMSRNVIMGASRLHPGAGIAAFALDRSVHFAVVRKRANRIGEALLEELEAHLLEHYPYVTHVNLVGHSLGGRVVVSALRKLASHPESCELIIGDVLLMAAAVEVSADEAQALNNCAAGRVINAYSKSDAILLMNVDETCVGRHEVPHFKNVEMTDFGHLDYWPKLHDVLLRTRFAGFSGQRLGAVMSQDPIHTDALLYGLMQSAPAAVLEQGIKHLKSSSWVSFDEQKPLYSFIQELQLLGGHCLANLTRGRGLAYANVLDGLVSHFDLGNGRQTCSSVVELEALLIRQVFDNAFPDGHAFSHSTIAVVKAMPADTYFKHVDALAERLTLASYLKSPSTPPQAEPSGELAVTRGEINLSGLATWNVVSALPSLLDMTPVGRWMTNLKTALKPGYSALVPVVAVVFFARVHWGNERGFKHP
jgi:pimeloyl-ACP methyl ester carboxylesterase